MFEWKLNLRGEKFYFINSITELESSGFLMQFAEALLANTMSFKSLLRAMAE